MFEKAKGIKSPWQPYINVLPEAYTTPAYFTKDELESLPESLGLHAERQVSLVRSAFMEVTQLLDTIESKFAFFHGVLTYEDFRWAWFVINTR